MYESLDLQTPNAALWIGLLFLLIGAAVVGHAVWRRKRYRSGVDQDSRYAGPDRDVDAGRERIAGIVMVVLGAVSLGYAIWGMNHGQDVMTQNLNTKYGVESVEDKGWRGNALLADLTMPDGTVHQDVTVLFGESGEPDVRGGVLEPIR
ncbi:hypothetical protein [Micrococcus terreus]|uniref:hypothetical protein n=1 Tax=Micrococcus terreus TaxID=574650 RepID=UPI0023FA39CB|nr:hypothetical protein [Micrococcus terreus]